MSDLTELHGKGSERSEEPCSYVPPVLGLPSLQHTFGHWEHFLCCTSKELHTIYRNNGNYITILLLIKYGAKTLSKLICTGLSFAFRFKRKASTYIKICCGIPFAVICSVMAWKVEMHRLSINKERDLKHPGRNTTVALVPQFFFLGVTEALLGGGFESLFHDHVPNSLRIFEDSFAELVTDIVKLLIVIPIPYSSWFKETVDTNRLDSYYLGLAILNAVLFVGFACYTIFRYAYKKKCPEDEKITEEQALEHVHQPDSQDSYPENNNETQPGNQEVEMAEVLEGNDDNNSYKEKLLMGCCGDVSFAMALLVSPRIADSDDLNDDNNVSQPYESSEKSCEGDIPDSESSGTDVEELFNQGHYHVSHPKVDNLSSA
ncbi:NRT1/ PTR FAMILY 5.7 [Spatholobus suberectus]|nr:NRT1/ PTR FAMILY 5.7 [Spatholobus suberectus]